MQFKNSKIEKCISIFKTIYLLTIQEQNYLRAVVHFDCKADDGRKGSYLILDYMGF